MSISPKNKEKLKLICEKLKSSTFDEDDISSLLLLIRPYSKQYIYIWELACFIAHAEERDKGIIHKEMDYVYSILVYGKLIKSESSKSLNFSVVDENIFNIYILEGTKRLSSDLLTDLKMSREQASTFVKNSYELKNKKYYLKSQNKNFNALFKIFGSLGCTLAPKPIINETDVISQLSKVLKEVNSDLNLDYNINEIISKSKNDILVAIVCLLHSCQFKLFDNTVSECKLDLKYDFSKRQKWTLSIYAIVNFGSENAISWPIIEIYNDIENVIPILKDITPTPEEDLFIELEGYNAKRMEDGYLKIC